LAALGGVVVPIVLFLALAPSGPASRGWGVPMATDIAFAVGVLALLGSRASDGAKLMLVSLAIVDDIAAILVIAAWYSDHLAWAWLGVALLAVALIVGLRRVVVSPWAYVIPAAVLWFAVFQSGVHATVAGVALGLLTPARPIRGRAVLEKLEHTLHPYSVFLVVPLFALVNAGVDVRGGALAEAVSARLTWAVVIGLVLGKTIGICGAVFTARRLRIGALPAQMPPVQVWPVAALGGIGFTVALFIADLAFTDQVLVRNAKVGILIGSAIAGTVGATLLRGVTRTAQAGIG
jgi:NhaA family Na+:H+ antiporter